MAEDKDNAVLGRQLRELFLYQFLVIQHIQMSGFLYIVFALRHLIGLESQLQSLIAFMYIQLS